MENIFQINEKIFINNLYYKEHQMQILSILIIMLFYLIQISDETNIKSSYKFLMNLNQIKLSIKGQGTGKVINSGAANSIIYDDSEIAFSSNINLKYDTNIIILKFSSSLSSCASMFQGCNQITEIDLTNFDSSQVQNMDYMFDGCTSLKTIKFGNFQTSKLKIMEYVFQNCEQLESLDLSSFDTSDVTDFHYMFSGCKSLKSLDLSNFKTPKCICTFHMFDYCISLTSVNLTSFDTSQVTYMYNMFSNCQSLVSLDLSSFETTKLEQAQNMFYGCTKLEYVNFIKASTTSSIFSNADMITNTATNIIFCVDDSKSPLLVTLMSSNSQSFRISDCSEICKYRKNLCCYQTCEDCDSFGNSKYHNCKQCRAEYNFEIEFNGLKNCYTKCANLFYLDDNNILTCVSSLSCPNKYSKLISDKKQCIKNCLDDKEYLYEFNNKCYKGGCPNGSKESASNKYLCLKICSKLTPFKLIATDNCVSYCPIDDIIIDNCELNYKENNENIEDKILFCIKEDLTKGYDLSQVDAGKDVFIERNSTTYIITSTENQNKETNRINIKLGSCETKLKNHHHISPEKNLYMLKIEKNLPGMKIPKIEYEVYFPFDGKNLEKLDLSVCKNEKIEIAIPVELQDDLYKYDPQSDYYNDICFTHTSDSGTDITLSDRHDDFVENNMTLCEEDCTFVRYDFINNKSICSCEIKINLPFISEITIDKNKLYDSFTDIKNIANVYILKCYKNLFSKKGLIKNYGSFILIAILFLYIICLIIFFACDYQKLKTKIDYIIYSKKNYTRLKKICRKEHKKGKKSKKKDIDLININPTTVNENIINNNLIILNGKKSKKTRMRKINSDNEAKKSSNTRSLILKENKKDDKKRKKKKKMKRSNKIKIKQIPLDNEAIKNLEKELNISNLNDNQKYDLCKKELKRDDYEMNYLSFEIAKKEDKRSYFSYYFSIVRTNHLFIFSFILSDYNIRTIKIILFFFIVSINFTVNALFFNDSTMHVIYKEKEKFDIIYQIPQIMYSSLISGIITALLKFLALTEKSIIYIKNEKDLSILNIRKKTVLTGIKQKLATFFIISFFFLLFFWYYIACFCVVYKNTQIHLIKDFAFSFGVSLLYPFVIYFFPGIFRICALKSQKRKYMYNFSQILQVF